MDRDGDTEFNEVYIVPPEPVGSRDNQFSFKKDKNFNNANDNGNKNLANGNFANGNGHVSKHLRR